MLFIKYSDYSMKVLLAKVLISNASSAHSLLTPALTWGY
jgi:hypothetical protein